MVVRASVSRGVGGRLNAVNLRVRAAQLRRKEFLSRRVSRSFARI